MPRPGILDRLLRRHPGIPVVAGQLPPRKVAWLNPLQLLDTGYHVWLSTAGTGLIDRRELLAALHSETVRVPDEPGCLFKRAERIDAALADPQQFERDGLWVDFVADVGDSWQATYAVASLLVHPDLLSMFPE